MRFDGFQWDGGNREKCGKHGVSVEEIEGLFAGPVLILPDKRISHGEQRSRAIGVTQEDRKVFVVFTMRGRAIRPISARYMHRREVSAYEKAYPNI